MAHQGKWLTLTILISAPEYIFMPFCMLDCRLSRSFIHGKIATDSPMDAVEKVVIVENGPCHYELLPSLCYYWNYVARTKGAFRCHVFLSRQAQKSGILSFCSFDSSLLTFHQSSNKELLQAIQDASYLWINSPLYSGLKLHEIAQLYPSLRKIFVVVHNLHDWSVLSSSLSTMPPGHQKKMVFCFLSRHVANYYRDLILRISPPCIFENSHIVFHNYYMNQRPVSRTRPLTDLSQYCCIQGNLEAGRRSVFSSDDSCYPDSAPLLIIGRLNNQKASLLKESILTRFDKSLVIATGPGISYRAYYALISQCLGIVPCLGSSDYLHNMVSSTIPLAVSLCKPLVWIDGISPQEDNMIQKVYGIPVVSRLSAAANLHHLRRRILQIKYDGIIETLISLERILAA